MTIILFLLIIPILLYGFALMHEIGHFVAAKLCRAHPVLILNSSGIPTAVKVDNQAALQNWQDLIITLSGAFGQTVGAVLISLQQFLPELQPLGLIYFAVIGLNFVPIFPSDGYYLLLVAKKTQKRRLVFACSIAQWSLVISCFVGSAYGLYIGFYNAASERTLTTALVLVIGIIVISRSFRRVIQMNQEAKLTGTDTYGAMNG